MWGLAWYLDRFESLAILEPVTTGVLVLGWFWTYQEQVAWSFGEYGAWMGLEAIIRYWPRVLDCGRCPELDFTGISSVWVSRTRLLAVFGGWMLWYRTGLSACLQRVFLLSTPGTGACCLLSLAWIIMLSCKGRQMIGSPTLPSWWHLDSLDFVHIYFVLVFVTAFICEYFWLLLYIYWILNTNSMDSVFSVLYCVAPEFSFNIF